LLFSRVFLAIRDIFDIVFMGYCLDFDVRRCWSVGDSEQQYTEIAIVDERTLRESCFLILPIYGE